ncbi:MAG: 4a-hydroxytetrahydrobiopterin dehydratase [Anaerolineae bacterium]|jgi:4a-hydroxytetrahydrobiopterin dehydratase|nr:4a-hydroxytetrahydrobiopterin dehydratase [Anaerolineae bacterium]
MSKYTPLTTAELASALISIPGWIPEGDVAISKTYNMPTYIAGVAFASAVAILAEAHDHHPDMTIGWKKVTVRFSTHDAGNKITQKDVEIAQAIEGLGYPKPA